MTGLSDRHLKLIVNRGLDAEIVSRHGIETCEGNGELIQIPYVLGSETVNHKYRSLDGAKRFRQDKNGTKCFWNFNVITDSTLIDEPLLICEGELDAIAAIQAGFPRTVSVPDGAPAEALGNDDHGAKYSYVRDALASMRDIKEIILCTDGDPPGVNLMNDLALRLGRVRCKWVTYPKGCSDLNDALRLYGVLVVQEIVKRARWVHVDGIYRMSELPPLSLLEPLDAGIPELGKHYKLRLGDFTVVTGIPGMGKSTWVADLCCHMVHNHGWDVAFASFETPPQIDHRRILRTWFGKCKPACQSQQQLAAADQWIDQHFSFICAGDDDDVTVPWLLEKAAASVLRHQVKIIVVDPWNEMDHMRPDGVSQTEYVGIAIKQFRRFAKKYQVHFICVAHPTKIHRDTHGMLPVPTLYDISDSANWANKADVGIVVHRGAAGTEATINVIKVRFQDDVGTPGAITANFNVDTGRFVTHEDGYA